MKRRILLGLVGLVVALVIIQVLPIGRVKNPPVTQEAPWPSEEARSIAVAACYDCHSNQVQLQWYDKIAPVSWYVTNHVNEGRAAVNFSEWDKPQRSDDLAESVQEGGMPLQSYTLLHSGGRLSDAEKSTLVDALQQLGEGGGEGGGEG